MNSIWKKVGLGAVLAVTALTSAVPAEAQRYHGGYRGGYHGYRGGYGGGGALVAGIAGLAVGAAIADSARPRYYAPPRGYYDGYRGGGYYRGGYEGCWVERRWDPYYRHDVRVRVCG